MVTSLLCQINGKIKSLNFTTVILRKSLRVLDLGFHSTIKNSRSLVSVSSFLSSNVLKCPFPYKECKFRVEVNYNIKKSVGF